jgi:hypothetical protein
MHIRRKFEQAAEGGDARGAVAVAYFRKIYDVERLCNWKSPKIFRFRLASCCSSSASSSSCSEPFAFRRRQLLLQLENLPNDALIFPLEQLRRLPQLLAIEIVHAERHSLSCSRPRSEVKAVLHRTPEISLEGRLSTATMG